MLEKYRFLVEHGISEMICAKLGEYVKEVYDEAVQNLSDMNIKSLFQKEKRRI